MQPRETIARRARRPPLIDAPAPRYALILALYGYQGLAAGFALTALPNHAAGLGASAEAVGAQVAAVGLPWVLQPLWGPLVDRFGDFRMGRRRFWVLAALAGALASLLPLQLLAAGGDVAASPWPATAVFVLHGAFAALLDTALDAMVIDRVPRDRLGAASACTRVGFVAGAAAGAALFSALIAGAGIAAAGAVLLALGAAAAVAPLAIRESADDAWFSLGRRGAAPGGGPRARLVAALRDALRRRGTLGLLLLGFALDFAAAAFRIRLGVDLIQAGGWSPEALSRLQGALALASGTAGALAIGWWSDRVGAGRALVALLGLCAVAHAGAAPFAAQGAPALAGAAALGLSTVAPALVFVALAPVAMRAARGPGAATRFAVFMAALNLGDAAGAAASGPVGSALGGTWQTALGAAFVFAACAAAAHRAAVPARPRR